MPVRFPTVGIAAVLMICGSAFSASADSSGLDGLHSQVRLGKRICMLDHFHSGYGKGRTKRLAKRAAVKDWAEFTAFEYGLSWARYRLAASRQLKCGRSQSVWQCSLEARPCRKR